MVLNEIKKYVNFENIISIVAILIIVFAILFIAYSYWYDKTHECERYKTVTEMRCNTNYGHTTCWTEDIDTCVKYKG